MIENKIINIDLDLININRQNYSPPLLDMMVKNYESIIFESQRKYCLDNIENIFKYLRYGDILTNFNNTGVYEYVCTYNEYEKNYGWPIAELENEISLFPKYNFKNNDKLIYIKEVFNIDGSKNKYRCVHCGNFYISEDMYNEINKRKYKQLIEEI